MGLTMLTHAASRGVAAQRSVHTTAACSAAAMCRFEKNTKMPYDMLKKNYETVKQR